MYYKIRTLKISNEFYSRFIEKKTKSAILRLKNFWYVYGAHDVSFSLIQASNAEVLSQGLFIYALVWNSRIRRCKSADRLTEYLKLMREIVYTFMQPKPWLHKLITISRLQASALSQLRLHAVET